MTLLGLLSLLLVLSSIQGSITVSLAHSSGLLTLGHNLFPGSTNDGALDLDHLASALLGDFLGGALLVQTTEEDSPVELTGILLGNKVCGTLVVQQAECLAVTTDKELAVTWVDLGTRKVAHFCSTEREG